MDRGKPIATFKGRRAEDVIAWFKGRPQAELEQVEVVVVAMSKTYASAIKALFGEQGQVMDRFHVGPQAGGTLDAVLRSVQKRLEAEEAKALKKLRKRWLKSANQLDVDEWIARYEWRRRFRALREVLDWGQNLRMWFDRTYEKAVTQKSPCEGKRVIIGEESALKLSQRGLDARQGGAHENPEAIIRPRTYDLST